MAERNKFWKMYLEKVVEKMVTGKMWYEFSMGSLRTFGELGMARESYKNCHIFKYGGYKIFINSLGRPLMIVYNNHKYKPPKGLTSFEIFYIALPVENIDAR